MESIIKKILAESAPLLISIFLANKHILIDFLREEAQKTDNKLDDAIVDILDTWLENL